MYDSNSCSRAVARGAILGALVLLCMPVALVRDDPAVPAPVGGIVPSCFVSGDALWTAARTDSFVCVPAAVAAVPRLGEACWRLYVHQVAFIVGAGGSVEATFTLADGATRGILPVDAKPDREAYVVDAHLGTDEPSPRGALACRLASSFHFYCPATRTLDHICLTWRGRGGR